MVVRKLCHRGIREFIEFKFDPRGAMASLWIIGMVEDLSGNHIQPTISDVDLRRRNIPRLLACSNRLANHN